MNLSKFLQAVDALSSKMEENQLKMFLHDLARVLPEGQRTDFLKRMQSHADSLFIETIPDRTSQITFSELKEQIEKIESWEMCLSGDINEEYDDWYHSDEDEFIYDDPEGIGPIIERACDFIHESIDKQMFHEGNEIAEVLVGLQIMVGGEYQEYSDDPLDLKDLERYGIASIDYKRLTVESLYLAYCANTLEDRPSALYQMIWNSGARDVSLEMVMQCGEELPEFQEFLPKWITCLGTQNTAIAQKLLNEAIDLSDHPDSLLEHARAYYTQHPGLYEKYICENQNALDFKTLTAIGKEALEKIDAKYLIRSKIALLLAEITLKKTGLVTDETERYWLEAFRSESTTVNYLRMMMECRDFSVWNTQLQQLNHHHHNKSDKNGPSSFYSTNPELRENIQDYNQIYLTAMLNGEYKFVKEYGMNFSGALGWSGSYMKTGLAAFLLVLYDSKALSASIRVMVNRIISSVSFSIAKYENGTQKRITDTDYEFFWTCILESKAKHPMSEEDQKNNLAWIEQLVEKRVTGIMENNRRKYYLECAEYIAALGEVLESRGARNGKQNFMLAYKQKYSRRSAFHAELRSCGMRDKK